MQKSPVPFDEASWQKDLPFIKAMIHREIDVDLFGAAAAYQNIARYDPQLQYALTLFPDAQQLLDTSRRSRTSRASR